MSQTENSDLTIQQLVFRKWAHEWDDRLKAHIERLAREMGCTWWEIVADNLDLFIDEGDEIGASVISAK
jgi:hypothetical protein